MGSKEKIIRVGIFDQIVSGGGVRLFTLKLLEEFSRQAGSRWRFHLMWPHFDSSNKFLTPPRLRNTTFERIRVGAKPGVRDKFFHRAYEGFRGGKLSNTKRLSSLKPVEAYEKTLREEEQQIFRSGTGLGLKWLRHRAHKFDLLYLPYPYLTLPRDEEWLPQKPLVITLHDLAHEHTDAWGEMTGCLQSEVRRWASLANLVIFSSTYIQNEAQRIYELPPERTKRIYLTPPASVGSYGLESSGVLSRCGIKTDYVFTLGWAARHKRVETIVEGFALFKKRVDTNLALVVAGPLTETILGGNLHGLEVGRDLLSLGYVNDADIPELYRHASAVVTASISEAGFNSMIFDAMYYEKPIICSNIPQFVERLGTDDRLALTFDPYTPQSLADALCQHFGKLEESARRVAEAKKFIDSRALNHVAREYLESFESVL
ncbi:MAG: glycosyltransferase [Pyrinomonadaceae bacterium]|nr:glycosyltransferase [Pyrinomonadaceae bacterium]